LSEKNKFDYIGTKIPGRKQKRVHVYALFLWSSNSFSPKKNGSAGWRRTVHEQKGSQVFAPVRAEQSRTMLKFELAHV
jgi:hypothetical protein